MPKVRGTMNKGSKSGLTDISGLPKNIVLDILMRLSIQEAVKTSVLSSNWRYTWTELPQLVFDGSFCEESSSKLRSKLIIIMYQVLLLHNGPLCKFTLNLLNLGGSCCEIDHFLLVALKKGVKDLMIVMREDEPYSLPTSIFRYGQQLKCLSLISCVFTSLECKSFSKLETLEMEEVDIGGRSLSSLIYNCPLLRWLDFSSSTSTGCVDIVAPNLEYLYLYTRGMLVYFKNTPRLTNINIYSCYIEDTEAFIEEVLESGSFFLSGRLPLVEELALGDLYLQHCHHLFPTEPSAVLYRVKSLYLWSFHFGVPDGVISALCLIRKFPNLEKLNIDVRKIATAQEVGIVDVESFSDVTLGNLKEVKLLDVSGFERELRFIEFVLAKSPILEKVLVKTDSVLADDKKLKFCKELTRFRRVSPLAEIAYED